MLMRAYELLLILNNSWFNPEIIFYNVKATKHSNRKTEMRE